MARLQDSGLSCFGPARVNTPLLGLTKQLSQLGMPDSYYWGQVRSRAGTVQQWTTLNTLHINTHTHTRKCAKYIIESCTLLLTCMYKENTHRNTHWWTAVSQPRRIILLTGVNEANRETVGQEVGGTNHNKCYWVRTMTSIHITEPCA